MPRGWNPDSARWLFWAGKTEKKKKISRLFFQFPVVRQWRGRTVKSGEPASATVRSEGRRHTGHWRDEKLHRLSLGQVGDLTDRKGRGGGGGGVEEIKSLPVVLPQLTVQRYFLVHSWCFQRSSSTYGQFASQMTSSILQSAILNGILHRLWHFKAGVPKGVSAGVPKLSHANPSISFSWGTSFANS